MEEISARAAQMTEQGAVYRVQGQQQEHRVVWATTNTISAKGRTRRCRTPRPRAGPSSSTTPAKGRPRRCTRGKETLEGLHYILLLLGVVQVFLQCSNSENSHSDK